MMILVITRPGFSQNRSIDVTKYHFTIKLSDQTDTIRGKARMTFTNLKTTPELSFDLVKIKPSGQGMQVDSVIAKGEKINFRQTPQILSINHKENFTRLTIYYHGIPADGLIIGQNKYGDRTFFGDNWPNRAHNWLPCIDHPSDKAVVKFTVDAPAHYKVISNGKLIKKKKINANRMLYDYQSRRPLPTKVMVIGVADFSVNKEGKTAGVPLSSWVYTENKKAGFYDYAQARPILKFYVKNIGPFPFVKLANVQSTTRYGGMENAGAIFYTENSVTGHRKSEFLLAHEIAHQWFGDSISETDWPQLWLSEGFATYFADLYAEHAYGEHQFKQRLIDARQKIVQFSKKNNTPIIDTTRTDLTQLLNANSYEKGSWVLHMLRNKVGSTVFWEAIRAYYQKYKFKNANSADLEKVFEQVSSDSLNHFFDQWLRRPGQPELTVNWDKKNGLKVKQTQSTPFTFPLEIGLTYHDGSTDLRTYQINNRKEHFDLPETTAKKIRLIDLDPRVKLLFEKSPGQSKILTKWD